jgi:hypothetical protein
MSLKTAPCVKKAAIAAVAACVLGLTCACTQDADAQDIFGDIRLCLSPDLLLSESGNPPPTRVEGAALGRLFANYSRFYRGPQPEVDLVVAYERGDVVLLVPFAEGCASSLPRKLDAECGRFSAGPYGDRWAWHPLHGLG